MELSLDDVDFMLGEVAAQGSDWLSHQSRSPRQRLAITGYLRKELGFTAHHCSLLLEQWELQELARQRQVFRQPEGLFLVRSALEQATHWQVGEHRASELRSRCGSGLIVELGCGLGGDSLELSRGGPVRSWEIDPVRAKIARYNTRGRDVEVHGGDFFEASAEAAGDALFVDPGRRLENKRIFDPEQYQPPLSKVLELRQRFAHLCIKAGPGIRDMHIPPDCEIQFVSHERTCKEAVLWLPALKSRRRASVLTPEGWVEAVHSAIPGPGILEVGGWIHEPDPALVRAGAWGELADQLEAGWIDPTICYLAGRAPHFSPLAQSFQILEIAPLQQKHLEKRLRDLKIWPLEIKKRGVPIEPEEYRKKLKLKATSGSQAGVLILTRRYDERLAILARRP